jgi:4-nitrophenyl phosphatase
MSFYYARNNYATKHISLTALFESKSSRGNRAVVCAVEAATGRSAINVGKPLLMFSSWIMEEYKLMDEETMMVGDRLDTDIKFGNTGGMKVSALVLTGCA